MLGVAVEAAQAAVAPAAIEADAAEVELEAASEVVLAAEPLGSICSQPG